LRLDEEQHIALVTLHHIISDGWSTGILIREVAALYEAYSEGKESPLEELEVQYADYAVWQREWLQGEVLEEQLGYWRKQLGGELGVVELPTDRPRPPVQSFKGARQTFEVGAEARRLLLELGREEGATLFMTLLAAFKVLLYRYGTLKEVTVGTPIAGRNRAEVEGLIGFFVNTLVLRTEMEGEPNFREVLRRVREVALGAYAHQDVPFQKLVEALRPERDLSHTPLFQVWFVLQRAPVEALKLPGLSFTPVNIDSGIAQFDLALDITESEQGLAGLLTYNSDLYNDDTISRMIGHFQTLLERVSDNPDQPISQLPLMSADETHKLLREWNDTRSETVADQWVHELFEQQAERTPQSIALVSGAEQITYEELNRRANQLANHLRALGVGPETLVGICVKRSVEMVVGILGILKAGGAYLPLDPGYPLKHLAFMLEDAQLPVLLTTEELEDELPSGWAQVVLLDADWESISQQPETNPASSVDGDNLAYVIYTSGSTGKPKGAMIAHRSLANYLNWCVRAYDVEQGTGAPLHSSIAFDLTITSLFPPLLTGRSVVLVKEEDGVEGLSNALLNNEQFSLVKITPAHLEVLKQLLPERTLGRHTNAFVIGGEALMWQSLAYWRQHAPETRLINEYGPTETVVGCCVYEVGAEESPASGGVPIGRPIANTQLYILDEQKRPVLLGVRGELHIGGGGVGRGYLNRPDQTAERFIPDPFSDEPGARLYVTGDLVRYLPDGNIEFLGRLDQQVKVRGFRIELGEIEAALAGHPEVRESAVVLREDAPGDQRLVGYVVPAPASEVAVPELLRYLKSKLPDYEVPSALVLLDELPLTVNGKVDVAALPAPAPGRPDAEKEFVAARTQVEKALAAVWSEVLRIESISLNDNFFDLGGHSLLAVNVISRIREIFQLEMAVRDLFDSPTIAALAESVERAVREGQSANAPRIERVPRDEPPPLSFAQQRLWFVNQLDPLNPAYNISSALRMTGQLNLDALEQTFSEIIRRHEALRTSFDIIEGRLMQIIHPARPAEFNVIDLREAPEAMREEEALRLATQEAQQPFDLAHGPLLRLGLLRLSDEQHIALVTLHHIISDGWSTGILIREVAALYEAYSEGKESPLEELEVQYADYAVWQREWLQGEVLEEQLGYWRKQLGGELGVVELPTDRPRPPVQSFKGARQTFEVGAEARRLLLELGREEGATLFMTLLAAFKVLLYRYGTLKEVTVGTPIAGRNRAEVEGLIGFFVNTLVLRTEMEGEPSFREVLRRVREVALGAYAHQDVPFEKLVEELQPVRDLSRPPLAQVFFTLENPQHEALKLPGLTLTPLESDSGTVKFDLVLSMADTGDGLRASLDYNVDLFDPATIASLVEHFLMLVRGIGENPEELIDKLPLLTEAESRQMLVEWNDTKADYHSKECIHQLFEAQAARSPDSVAAVYEDTQLTYAQLDRRANQLAHRLRRMGVGAEVRVGLCVERSLEMVVGLLGILKAGGAYVPLDPLYPSERLAFMLADSQCTVLLTQQHLLETLPAQEQARVICLDTDREEIDGESEETPQSDVTPRNLAYMIYTSGSTGKPKGTLVEHRGLCNMVEAQIRAFDVSAESRILQFASLSFDASVSEVFTALLAGATIHLEKTETLLPGPTLSKVLHSRAITTVTFPPALLALMPAEDFPALRTLVVAGEACSAEVMAKWSANRRFLNAYGPTEATVCATIAECRDESRKPPIGRPIANTQVYLLDRQLSPVPVGVAGELFIGGAGLARGYQQRPELTAEKFIPNPFSDEPGARLYRTGDLARFLRDGQIDYLGRLDEQVKIRGFRIELGEIEAVLQEHPSVRESIVMAREDAPGDTRLVAYMVAAQPQPTTAELRGHVKAKLPEFMIPSAFIMLDALPLTASGKVDRRALPAPGDVRREAGATFVGPRSGSEREIVAIWEEVLRVENVGVYDNFFELGGHSLLMIQVRNKLEEKLQRKVTVADLFKYPTVNALAKFLDQESGEAASDTPP
ncbi:MAG TPA: amino acid adenylation domain-containing protein, partial [Pyrinomonadaceae bacterium]|nr:amino acid adenylation domain-containing protein [Pyrinomonadaceae bacterium]